MVFQLTPIECQSNANGMSTDFKRNANWIPMECNLTTIRVSLICQWDVNWWPMECLLTNNWLSIDFQLSFIGLPMESLRKLWTGAVSYTEEAPVQSFFSEPIECQLISNWVSLDCQWNHSENFERVLSHIIYIMRKHPFKVFLVNQLITNGVPMDFQWSVNGITQKTLNRCCLI